MFLKEFITKKKGKGSILTLLQAKIEIITTAIYVRCVLITFDFVACCSEVVNYCKVITPVDCKMLYFVSVYKSQHLIFLFILDNFNDDNKLG